MRAERGGRDRAPHGAGGHPLVSAVAGTHDLVLEVRAPTVEALHSALRRVRSHPSVRTAAVTLYHHVVKSAFSTHPPGTGDSMRRTPRSSSCCAPTAG
ncbi:Lrp/AsnC ligand binding domain-containing protein [Nesterenkonia sp. NBAIMH1]|uniref:Lrp/AsnC ligand binding domain-containing protein n=1 Tax=Nesterenkonia sp. NBAIMH1 TaxID=2600320 RepID=UPI001FED3B48|nr:Lrp/AsnC ligand binding domain-containing protein [Nesterenkonia sp. NBAIMH1]